MNDVEIRVQALSLAKDIGVTPDTIADYETGLLLLSCRIEHYLTTGIVRHPDDVKQKDALYLREPYWEVGARRELGHTIRRITADVGEALNIKYSEVGRLAKRWKDSKAGKS